jgi:hypothetical protein
MMLLYFSSFIVSANPLDLVWMVTVSENMMDAKYYTFSNNEEFVDDDGYYRLLNNSDKVCAKAMKESKGKNILKRNANYYKYYVKVATNKNLYDPFESHGIKNTRVSFIDKIKDNGLDFMEVNQSVFNKYINYLKTQNSQWLTEAKRELT